MRAEAVVEVERRDGRDACTTLRSAPPLSLRETPGAVQLVSSGAGPLGGDVLVLRIRVGAGARLVLRSIGASLALPGVGPSPGRLVLEAEVGAGAALDLAIGPQIVAAAADLEVETTIRMAADARLRWREHVVLGREGEGPGSLHQRLRVARGGAPLVATDLAVGPRWPASLGPGGVDGARVLGSLLCIGEPAPPPTSTLDGGRGTVLDVEPAVWMAVGLAARSVPVSAWLDRLASTEASPALI